MRYWAIRLQSLILKALGLVFAGGAFLLVASGITFYQQIDAMKAAGTYLYPEQYIGQFAVYGCAVMFCILASIGMFARSQWIDMMRRVGDKLDRPLQVDLSVRYQQPARRDLWEENDPPVITPLSPRPRLSTPKRRNLWEEDEL